MSMFIQLAMSKLEKQRRT